MKRLFSKTWEFLLCAIPASFAGMFGAVLGVMLAAGCAALSGRTAYQSIAITEAGVLAANSAYLDSVVTGQTPTNSVPKVEAAFNDTQLALHTAASLASGGASAPTPPATFAKAVAFTNTVNEAKGK